VVYFSDTLLVDLRQYIAGSSIIFMLNENLLLEQSPIQQASLDILLSMLDYGIYL